jgi:phytoene dehydrogenase-like protein
MLGFKCNPARLPSFAFNMCTSMYLGLFPHYRHTILNHTSFALTFPSPTAKVHKKDEMGVMTMDNSSVDILIVGAGPAGLMTANWMSRLGVKTRIIDKRGTKVTRSDELSQHKLMIYQDLQRPSRRFTMPLA